MRRGDRPDRLPTNFARFAGSFRATNQQNQQNATQNANHATTNNAHAPTNPANSAARTNTLAPTSTSTSTPRVAPENNYYETRQSTMDSETLDRLLVVERNIFEADRATAQVWKLVGHYPDTAPARGQTPANARTSNAPAPNTGSMRFSSRPQDPTRTQTQTQPPAPTRVMYSPHTAALTSGSSGVSGSSSNGTANMNGNAASTSPNAATSAPPPIVRSTTSSKIIGAAQARKKPAATNANGTPFSGSPESVFAASGISFASSASHAVASAPHRSQIANGSGRRGGNASSPSSNHTSPSGSASSRAVEAATSPSRRGNSPSPHTRSRTENGTSTGSVRGAVLTGSLDSVFGSNGISINATGSSHSTSNGYANGTSNGTSTSHGARGAVLTGNLDSVFGSNGISIGTNSSTSNGTPAHNNSGRSGGAVLTGNLDSVFGSNGISLSTSSNNSTGSNSNNNGRSGGAVLTGNLDSVFAANGISISASSSTSSGSAGHGGSSNTARSPGAVLSGNLDSVFGANGISMGSSGNSRTNGTSNSNGNVAANGDDGALLTGNLDSVFGSNGISFSGTTLTLSGRGAGSTTTPSSTSNRERCLPLMLPSNDSPKLTQQNSGGSGSGSNSGRHFVSSPHSASALEIPRRETRNSFAAMSPSSATCHRTQSSCGSDESDTRTRSMVSSNLFGFNGDMPPRSENSVLSFTVKKTDTVFDSWSKRSSLLLQVDLEAAMVHILSTLENRESYSCAAVTMKDQARLGMILQIVTGNTTVSKKIAFLSQDDRNSFHDALEQGKMKVHREKTQPNYRPYSNDDENGSEGMRDKIREAMSDNFTPLPGENVFELVQRVTNLVVISQSDRAVHGMLRITTYRITFSPYDSMWKMGSFELPLAAIDTITRDGLMLLINSKDLRTIRLAMHDAFTRKKGFDQMPQAPDYRWLNQLMVRMKPPVVISSLFAFDYFAEKKALMAKKQTRREDGWLLYSPIVEYRRLGFLKSADSANTPQDPNQITWRLLKNNKFRFSPTYPQLMVVPSLMSEEQLVQSARFRSRARLPTVVWRHPVSKCVLARSSQPNYGMTGSKSEPDRILLRAFRDSANKNGAGVAPRLHIIDARKIIATRAYRVRGKGVENSQHYDNASIEFMGIANIHKMRESLEALKALVSPNSVDDGDKHYHNRLENTRWLKHVMRVLSGARRVAKILHEDGASVLVHCSDGWDRTPQLVGLAQLILDPYYRTIRGFAVLVEKEWCSFGHKFADRIGVGKDPADQPNERSPVMLQFLDCVWQMTRQFPTAFEFNERFLLHVSDALISGLYGTFLYNSERERVLEKVWERTESVWTPVLERPEPFKNPMYRTTNCVLYPRANLKRVVLWDAMFFRWDPESNPDYMGYMDPNPDLDESEERHEDAIADGQRLPVRLPSTAALEETEFKPLSLDIDNLDAIHDMQTGGALSDCSSMSDDEDDDPPLPYGPEASIPYALPLPDIEDSSLTRLYRQAEEKKTLREQARDQMRSIREAIKLGPDDARIKYLEQLLNESVSREQELEDELDATYQRVKMQRAGFGATGAPDEAAEAVAVATAADGEASATATTTTVHGAASSGASANYSNDLYSETKPKARG